MIGVVLTSIGSFFEEISDSIGKNKVNHHEESQYTMAFLSLFWGTIFFILISLLGRNVLVFNPASLPTFLIRIVLEVILLYVSVLAINKTDRTTFSFVRTITIPLLLMVDIFLGYKIGLFPIIGITVLVLALFITFSTHGIKKKGIELVIFSSIIAVISISLFKYDITHFNSIVAEQLPVNIVLLICFWLLAVFKAKENPFVFLIKPMSALQSVSFGLGGIIESFAYGFGAASIITAAKRSSAIFWSIIFGKAYFKEKHILFKLSIFFLMLIGLFLLSMTQG